MAARSIFSKHSSTPSESLQITLPYRPISLATIIWPLPTFSLLLPLLLVLSNQSQWLSVSHPHPILPCPSVFTHTLLLFRSDVPRSVLSFRGQMTFNLHGAHLPQSRNLCPQNLPGTHSGLCQNPRNLPISKPGHSSCPPNPRTWLLTFSLGLLLPCQAQSLLRHQPCLPVPRDRDAEPIHLKALPSP